MELALIKDITWPKGAAATMDFIINNRSELEEELSWADLDDYNKAVEKPKLKEMKSKIAKLDKLIQIKVNSEGVN